MGSSTIGGGRLQHRTARLDIRGIDYHVHEWGEPGAPPLVMLHGWGDCGASFRYTAAACRRRWRVIAPDWRGFGDSGHNPAGYWFPDYLADLDALLAACGLAGPVPLVGHSMGGNVATLFAGVFPKRVSALVNVEGFGLPDSNPADAADRYRQWVEAGRRRSVHPGYATLAELEARIRERSPAISATRAREVARSWAVRDGSGRWQLKADAAHRWPNAVLYRRAEAEACWRRIAAPTLLVCGAGTTFADAARAWREDQRSAGIPGARVRVIEGAGHMLHLEQPAALAAAIEAHIAAPA